jgi:FlaA1/EpsC-like NDP-sugar epimerase
MNILITGSSGYLGRFILENINREEYNNIICIINSEKRYKENEFLYKNCKIYKGDIGERDFIKTIFSENKINYVIHAAAMKYIDTCEKFQQSCINTNITGTLNICYFSKKYNVTNVLTISTDKANNPGCLYGISKLASERITISHGFSVYQGVNFWNSDGSFLQKWKTSISNKKKIILYNKEHIRYFSEPNKTASDILKLIKINNNKVNYPEECWKIKIFDVFNILKNKYKNCNFIIESSEENSFDKIEEEINEVTKVKDINKEKLIELLNYIFKY